MLAIYCQIMLPRYPYERDQMIPTNLSQFVVVISGMTRNEVSASHTTLSLVQSKSSLWVNRQRMREVQGESSSAWLSALQPVTHLFFLEPSTTEWCSIAQLRVCKSTFCLLEGSSQCLFVRVDRARRVLQNGYTTICALALMAPR